MLKLGTDIIEIDRIERAIQRPRFLQKYFTKTEIDLINTKGTKTAAANFCGKEAVAKALGCGFDGFFPCDVEILRNEYGAPYVVLHNEAKKKANEQSIKNIAISLSHSKNYATATVILS